VNASTGDFVHKEYEALETLFFWFPQRLRVSAVKLVLGFSVLSPCLRASVVGFVLVAVRLSKLRFMRGLL
jgi:hypothetical protein